MKINKLILILVLSLTSLFCSNSIYSANTPKDYTQYKLGVIPASENETGTIELNDFIENNNVIKSINLDVGEYTIPNLLPEVLDQGPYSSCVSYALRGIKDILGLNNENPNEDHSAGFIYAHRIGGYEGEGMYSIDAISALKLNGTCLNSSFSDQGNYPELKAKITQSMIDEAKNHRIKDYIRLHNISEIKKSLVNIGPVYISFRVYSSFYRGGILPVPDKTLENYNGNHATSIIGWKMIHNKLYFKILNSWGKDWGEFSGYCYMPAEGYPINEYWAIVDSNEKEITPPNPMPKIKRLDIEVDYPKVFVDSNLQLSAIVDGKYNFTDKAEWSTSNPSIATIDNNGLLIANSNKTGKVKITAKYLNKTDTKYITIVDTDKYYSVQVLSTKIESDADNLVDELISRGLDYNIYVFERGNYYKVMIGDFANKGEIYDLYKIIKNELGYKGSKIVFVREDV